MPRPGPTAGAGPDRPARRRFLAGLLQGDPEHPRHEPWRRVEVIAAGAGDVFWAAWAGGGVLLVLGDEGAIFRYAEGGWTRLRTPTQLPIHAVWGAREDALCAVGWMGTILASDADGWHRVQGGVVGDDGRYAPVQENAPLFDVAGNAAGRLWAVGDHGTILTASAPFGPWELEPSGTACHLRAVTALPDGRVVAAGADGTVLLRDVDGPWHALDCPVRTGVQAIHAAATGEVLLAGGSYRAQANGFRGDLLRWCDGRFQEIAAPEPLPRLRALVPYQGGTVIAGDGGGLFFLERDRLDRLVSGTRHDLLGVAAMPEGGAVTVGDFGTVLAAGADFHRAVTAPNVADRAAAPAWTAMASGTDRQLWSVRHLPGLAATFACGEDGTVLRLSGGRWAALPPVGRLGLRDVCEAGDGGILAAGQLGEIHHFDGERWRLHHDLGLDVTLLSLWSDGAGCVVASGDEGLILRWDGDAWRRQPSGTRSALYALWGIDDRHLLAVGDFGLILRWNGTRWDEFHAGSDSFLFDVCGTGLDDIHVAGLSGTLGHFDGRRWQLTPARVRTDLLGIAAGGGAVVAVGAGGTALARTASDCTASDWKVDATGTDAGLRAVAWDPVSGHVAVGDRGTVLCRNLSGAGAARPATTPA